MGFFVSKKDLERTETEYAGTVPSSNTIQPPDSPEGERPLETHERLRLGYLTGQTEDVDAPRKLGFMHGVDPDFPQRPDILPVDEWGTEQ